MEQNQIPLTLNVVVLGANGGIGKHAVLSALNAGHQVTAILRTPANLEITHPNLQIVQGDIMKPETLDKYLENKDVVISAIGKNSLKKTTLYSQGNKNLIDAMKRAGVNRAFFISASGLEVNPTHSLLVKFLTKFILQTLLRNMYADLWEMEKIVKESNINWTIMRPPKLLNSPETGKYRTAIDHYLNKGLEISRADVAHFIVNNLTNKAIIKKTVEIAY
ncbi:MAG: family oxidoreductase [Mucilaginibacter sp.]|nr:family oxidoreductase [Mucilaginibacter sp.]